jgi:tetratricopeptide (TPR) repeat protein
MTPTFQAGLHFYYLDRHAQAIEQFHRHLAEEPRDGTAHAYLALCLLETEQLAEATAEARLAIECDPAAGLGFYVLGRAWLARNRTAEARQALNEAIRLDPEDASYHGTLGLVEMHDHKWLAALAAADQGLAFDPENGVCLNVRSTALTHLGRRDEAAQTMQEALANDPENSWTHANQGWAELHHGKPKRALEHFREALRLDATNEWARAGIVEAMKARNIIYRVMLGFFLWMTRLPSQWRWGVIAAIFIAPKILRGATASNPSLAWATEPLVQCIYVFAAMTWIAYPLFNLILRFDRFGRHALSPDQVRGANLLAVTLFPALSLWIASLVTGEPYKESLFLLAVVFAALVLPASVLYSCAEGWPRKTMLVYFLVLTVFAVIAVPSLVLDVYFDLYHPVQKPPMLVLLGLPGLALAVVLAISPLVTFVLANWLVSARVRR